MSSQQQAREALRPIWPGLIEASLLPALTAAQTEAAAEAVVAAVWPGMRIEDMIRLDKADESFLLRGPKYPKRLAHFLQLELERSVEEALRTLCPKNQHTRAGGLRRLLSEEIERQKSAIRDEVDKLFEAECHDRFCSPSAVRELVLRHLSDRILDELKRLGGSDEADVKRQLKMLTAITTLGGHVAQREARLCQIETGTTAAFPYVPKYLNRGECPSVQLFPPKLTITLSGFRNALVTGFPEARHVRTCLERYQARTGVIGRFIDPEGELHAIFHEAFDAKPSFVPREGSGIMLPKRAALCEARRDTIRLPDGVVCAVTLGVLLESVLRQVASALQLGCGRGARGGDLLRRVGSAISLSSRTTQLLDVVFDQRSLSLRDAMAHGAFFAADKARLETVLAGLTRSLDYLGEDLVTAGIETTVYQAPRWDGGWTLDAAVPATLAQEYRVDQNLTSMILSRGRFSWLEAWQKMQLLIPDKFEMVQAASLLWVSGQEDAKLGRRDDTHHFAAIIAGLVVLEELFRAVYELHGRRVLRVKDQGPNRLQCELAILDNQPGNLLDPAGLQTITSTPQCQGSFSQMLVAVREVRDLVLHGAWQGLTDAPQLYHHIIMKAIYRLCDAVEMKVTSPSTLPSQEPDGDR